MLAACAVSPSYTNSTSQGGRTERIATRCAVFGGVCRSMFSGPLPLAQEEQIWACGAPARRGARLPQVNRAKLGGAKVSDAELSSS